MRKLSIGLFLMMLLLLSACMTDNSEEKALSVYEQLEEAAQIEIELKDLQEPLIEAEEKEVQYYTEMAEVADLAELAEVSMKAIESSTVRKGLMEQEKEKIDESYAAFKEVIPLLEEIEEEEVVNEASELISIMEERYLTYEKLHEQYMNSVQYDNQLYEMISDEDVTLDEIEEQLTQINKIYEEINGLNETFNELTSSYNKQKKSLYESMQLNVVFE